MYHRVTTEIDFIPYNNIFHIQFILCFITKGIRSSTVKMSALQHDVLIYQKDQELAKGIRLIEVN